jgi:membrane-associated phospholipid phosphatase
VTQAPHAHRVRVAFVTAVVAAVLFDVLLLNAMNLIPWAQPADVAVHSWVVGHRSATLVHWTASITGLGTSAVVVPSVFVVALAATPGRLRARLTRAAVAVLVSVCAMLCRFGLSQVVERARPPRQDWAAAASGFAFPSGHSTDSALAAGMIGWMVFQRIGRRALLRVVVWVAAGAFVGVIGWTRVYLGVHWPSDVLGGWTFALAWLAAALGIRRYRCQRGESD